LWFATIRTTQRWVEEVAGLADDGEHGKLSRRIKAALDATRAKGTAFANEADWIFGRRTARVLGIVVLFAVVVALLLVFLNWYVAPDKPGERKDLVLALAQILAGTALLSGLYFTWRTLQVNREGQITERFTRAIDQLGKTDDEGDKLLEIRLGGIYALERIARESEEDHWPIMEVLTAYVRQHAPLRPKESQGGAEDAAVAKKSEEDSGRSTGESEPTEVPAPGPDIQAIMTVLRRRSRSFGHGEPERLDLSETDLTEAHLSGADLSGADLTEANLTRAHLSGAILQDSLLTEADLSGAILSGANLPGVNLSRANLSGANLSGANLSGAILTEGSYTLTEGDPGAVDFREVWEVYWEEDLSEGDLSEGDLSEGDLSEEDLSEGDLSEGDLSEVDLPDAILTEDFTEANLTEADLSGADLSGAILSGANLPGVILSGANLSGANLSGAILTEAILTEADLTEANLSGANFRSANLTGAILGEVNLRGTDLRGANLRGANLKRLILSQAQLDETNGDENTRLPPDLKPPAHWGVKTVKTDEQAEED
jgi:uncharacterized protein YjbI with pentapeptide repeats